MAQDAEEEEAIVVTGTRLVRQDFEAISPITTVGAEQLELTATLTTDSLLNELPQIVPGNTRTSNNAGGEDFATVDLRGLGPGRTLVLVNGERIPASSTTGVVDINTIPASLLSRIEVVTGGASAVYGSDALAGVINFVLKEDYEGARSQHHLRRRTRNRQRGRVRNQRSRRRQFRQRPWQHDRIRFVL